MTRDRMLQILVEEFEKSDLPPGAAAHLDALRTGQNLSEGMKAVLAAMERAINEERGMK